jgi:type I restriction enzyme S subunit
MNMNVPSLRFKEFTDEWVITKLGSIGTTYSGLSGKSSSDFGHGQGNYVTYLNVFENSIANLTLVGKVEVDKSQNEILYGDVLFTTSSETPFDVGMSSVWLGNAPNTYLNSFCFGYRPQVNVNPFYLGYLFRANVFRKQMFTLAQGISRYNISKNKVMESYIKIPSIDEQVNIGKLFNDMDSLITLHQQKHEKLINVKKAFLDKLFPKDGEVIPSLRFKGFVDEWEPTKLGNLGIIVTGNTPPTSNPNYYSIEGIPWVTPTDISQNITTHSERMLSKEGQTVARVVPTNTILVTCIASIGKNTLLGTVGSFNQQINALIPNPNHDKYFLYTQSSHWSNHMKRMGGGLTFQIVNKKEFSVIDTTIPNFAEQKKVGDLFNKIDSLINLYQQKHEKLINVKKALLQKMFV